MHHSFSHLLCYNHAWTCAPGVSGLKSYLSYSCADSAITVLILRMMIRQWLLLLSLYEQLFSATLFCRICSAADQRNAITSCSCAVYLILTLRLMAVLIERVQTRGFAQRVFCHTDQELISFLTGQWHQELQEAALFPEFCSFTWRLTMPINVIHSHVNSTCFHPQPRSLILTKWKQIWLKRLAWASRNPIADWSTGY